MENKLECYAPGDLADILKIKRSTVYEMLHAGELPCVVIRQGARKRTFRVYKHALERWLKNRELQRVG